MKESGRVAFDGYPYHPTSMSPNSSGPGYLVEHDQMNSALVEMSVLIILSALQCALLHPRFKDSFSARLTRLCLGPITVTWWMFYPFRYPFQPYELHTAQNLGQGLFSEMMALKTLEWTIVSGPYFLRAPKIVDGVPIWVKEDIPKSFVEGDGFVELIWWTLVQMASQRGLRWSWGPTGRGNSNTLGQTVVKIIRLQLTALPCLAFLLHTGEAIGASPANALISLGLIPFPGISVFAQGLHSLCFVVFVSSIIELIAMTSVVGSHLLHPIAQMANLPPYVCETLNPVNHPPYFNSIFDLYSLAHFWGKSWHQKFRRGFLVCGGQPAASLARWLGAPPLVVRACKLIGVFTVSGIIHEFPMYMFQRPPHPNSRVLLRSFPGPFLFFFVQSFGMLAEPFIIPRIPTRFGGGRIWTASFLLVTGPMFSRVICQPEATLLLFRPLKSWTWMDLVVPIPLANFLFS